MRYLKAFACAGALVGTILSGVASAETKRSANMLPQQASAATTTAAATAQPEEEKKKRRRGGFIWLVGGAGLALALAGVAMSGDNGSSADSPG